MTIPACGLGHDETTRPRPHAGVPRVWDALGPSASGCSSRIRTKFSQSQPLRLPTPPQVLQGSALKSTPSPEEIPALPPLEAAGNRGRGRRRLSIDAVRGAIGAAGGAVKARARRLSQELGGGGGGGRRGGAVKKVRVAPDTRGGGLTRFRESLVRLAGKAGGGCALHTNPSRAASQRRGSRRAPSHPVCTAGGKGGRACPAP